MENNGPLSGVTVIDLTRNAPGPFCTMILGDMGADVIWIYNPAPISGRRSTEASEAAPDPMDDPFWAVRGSRYDALGRNKRSIGLNLKEARARQILHQLIGHADVFVEEMRPGATKRLGCDYETLNEINPRLVYCSISGYGQDGPYAHLPGHDLSYIAHSGALSVITDPSGRPVIPQTLLGDFAGGGLMAAYGVTAALFARERDGRGQYIDAAMVDGIMYLMVEMLSIYFGWGLVVQGGTSPVSGSLPFYDIYRASDGKYLAISCLEPWFYANLCRALDRADLIPHAWVKNRQEELRAFLTETIATRPRDEWFEILIREDVCVAKVNTVDELDRDPQVRARQMIVEGMHPDVGVFKQVGIAPKLSRTPGQIRTGPTVLGEHTDEILRELHFDDRQISALRRQGVVG